MDTECRWRNGTLQVDILLHRNIDVILYPLIEKIVSEIVVRKVKGVQDASWSGGMLVLEGANMEILSQIAHLDIHRSYSNDIHSVSRYLGIEAAKEVIIREVRSVFDAYGIRVDFRHLALISDYMTRSGGILPFSRNGFTEKDSILQRMSFESCYTGLRAAVQGEQLDSVSSPSACQILGVPVKSGTGSFALLYNIEQH